MKNYYKKASFSSVVICLAVCAILLLLFISEALSRPKSLPWQLLLLSVVMGICAVYTYRIAADFRKECRKIRTLGTCYRGKIVQCESSTNSVKEGAVPSYRYLVKYYSTSQQRYIWFWTPYASLPPEKILQPVCNVYEYERKVIADDFEIISKKR